MRLKNAVGMLAIAAVLFAACGDAGTVDTGSSTISSTTTTPATTTTTSGGATGFLDEVDQQRDLWEQQGIDSYTFVLTRLCFCVVDSIGPFEMTVVDGVVVEALFKGEPADDSLLGTRFTIDGLFDIIEENASADAIDVAYSADLGIPLNISIDPVADAADEEVSYRVEGFTPSA